MDGSDTASPKNIEEGSGVKDVKVPLILQEGTPMTKVSAKKQKTVILRIDPDEGYILWESKKSGVSEYFALCLGSLKDRRTDLSRSTAHISSNRMYKRNSYQG